MFMYTAEKTWGWAPSASAKLLPSSMASLILDRTRLNALVLAWGTRVATALSKGNPAVRSVASWRVIMLISEDFTEEKKDGRLTFFPMDASFFVLMRPAPDSIR